MTDCTRYLAISKQTGGLVTRDGHVLVASEDDWKSLGNFTEALVPAPSPLFGARELIDLGSDSEIAHEDLYAVVLRAMQAKAQPGVVESYARVAADAVLAHLYLRVPADTAVSKFEP